MVENWNSLHYKANESESILPGSGERSRMTDQGFEDTQNIFQVRASLYLHYFSALFSLNEFIFESFA